jgi:hypothetical protein
MASTTGAVPAPRTPKSTPSPSNHIAQRRSAKNLAESTSLAMTTAGWHDAARHDQAQPNGPTTNSHPAYSGTGRATPAGGLGNPLYAYLGAGDLALTRLRASGPWPMAARTVTDEAAKLQAAWTADLAQLHQSLTREKLMRASLSLDQLRALPGRTKRVLTHFEDYAIPVGTIAVSVGDVAASVGDGAVHWYRELVARGERVATGRR